MEDDRRRVDGNGKLILSEILGGTFFTFLLLRVEEGKNRIYKC